MSEKESRWMMQWLVLIFALGFFSSRVKSIKLGFWLIAIEFWEPTSTKPLSNSTDTSRQLD
jgi:hypothetical protein